MKQEIDKITGYTKESNQIGAYNKDFDWKGSNNIIIVLSLDMFEISTQNRIRGHGQIYMLYKSADLDSEEEIFQFEYGLPQYLSLFQFRL